jgi:hypothetical protein
VTLGRQKGNSAEREIAKVLADYWKPVEDAKFVRTPLSGGWGGKDVRAGFRAGGDLMTTAKKWPFVVEVKRREGWSWAPFLSGKKSPVWGWWKQACAAAKELEGEDPARAVPLLVFRKNREPWQVVLPHRVVMATTFPEVAGTGGMRAWYPKELGGVAGLVHPISTSFSRFLELDPREWYRACAACADPRFR